MGMGPSGPGELKNSSGKNPWNPEGFPYHHRDFQLSPPILPLRETRGGDGVEGEGREFRGQETGLENTGEQSGWDGRNL